MLLVLLSACDADKAPAPPAKATASAPAARVDAPAEAAKAAKPVAESESAPAPASADKPVADAPAVHSLAPNITTVPVVASGKASAEAPRTITNTADNKPAGANAKSAKVKADNAEVARRAPVASKSKSASQVVKETRLNKVPLDLSLPPEMVKQLTPPSNVITSASKAKAPSSGAKPLLPKMFPDANADPDFQMQGRLLSNEMDLQLRNEARKDVEGAALDFKFKQ
ncbi:translation initiation factor 2 [Pseudomonas petrae]|uniref:Translation initiation factor 2 n=1 Tax=Pseudomonas petrae TaxID=2912190 RepID=A0ABS9IBT6_9PSED|nr:translation initiation factor 2 [Pseudomonas petrae]MCF7538958.1 translation initiation factor 2 [Pseudomonas petrae]MCF7544741.1 translation initiation factor 2 [Pseudomonas petrae]MCF7556997.1 translation initiation factor 2 [Pseudomonas petrae]